MEIETKSVAITTTGSAGSATGSGTILNAEGLLLDVFIDYNGSAPATTDVTLWYSQMGDILIVSNNNTDALLAARQTVVDKNNASISGGNGLYALDGQILYVSVGGCDALTNAVILTIRYLKL